MLQTTVIDAKPISLMIKIFPYVIIYPLGRELFAFSKTEICDAIRDEYARLKRWTTLNGKRGCKNISHHYNASPSLKALIAQK